jgi:rhodanese-related sulfurtransferase
MKLLPIVMTAFVVTTIAMTPAARAQSAQTQPPAAPPAQPGAPATPAAPAAPAGPQIQPMDESHRIQADQVDKLLAEGKALLLDVREPKEREELGTIEGSVNIPIGQLEKRLNELPKDRLILTACNSGGRAARAAALLEKNGFKTIGFCGLKEYKGKKVYPKPPSA